MASNQSSLLVGAVGEEPKKGVDHLIGDFVSSLDSHYDFTSLSSLNTKYTDVAEPLDKVFGQDGSKTRHGIPIVPTLSLSSPPTTVSFPEMKANLTPGNSRAPDQSSICGSDWEILKSELQRLVRDHENISPDRLSVQQKRANLRQKRAISTDLGAALMRELNAYFAKQEAPSPLFALFEQYQKSWAEYLLIENEYEEQEDRLDDREFQLEETQKKIKTAIELYDNGKGAIANLVPTEDQENLVPSLSYEAGAYHPLVAEYLSRRGTLDLVVERLWDLRMEHKETFEDYQMGKGLSSQPNEEAIDLLTNFKKYEDEILREKEALEKEIEQLKAQCDEMGLSEDPLASQLSESEPETPILDSLQSLPAYKHLLWEKGSPRFFESALSQEPIETGAYINKWIFHQLCQSSLEVLHLRQSLGSENMKIDSDKELLDLALRYWKFDAAAKPVSRPISELCSDDFNDLDVKATNVQADHIDLNAADDTEPNTIHNFEENTIYNSQIKATRNTEIPTYSHFSTRPGRYSSLVDYNKHDGRNHQPNPGRRQVSSAIFHYDRPPQHHMKSG